MLNLIESFFQWSKKHDFFISGFIISLNLVASIQNFNTGDTAWGWTSLFIAFALWFIYYKNVNAGEPKYKD